MAATYSDRLSEVRARLSAANMTKPARVRVGYEGARHVPLIDHGEGLDAEVVARTFEQTRPWPRAEFFANAPDDLRWAVEEIDYLRLYIRVLGDFAYALDTLRWALEEPAPGRVERRRRILAEARQELLAIPNWRPGECHSGCRRYATHELVIEQDDGSVEREPCCEECGSLWLAARRAAIDAGRQPAATLRLEPITQRARREEEGGR
jgi:hypothetical protein